MQKEYKRKPQKDEKSIFFVPNFTFLWRKQEIN